MKNNPVKYRTGNYWKLSKNFWLDCEDGRMRNYILWSVFSLRKEGNEWVEKDLEAIRLFNFTPSWLRRFAAKLDFAIRKHNARKMK